MAGFADLLAAAVGHDRARTELSVLAEQQAVLRRLAVLVALGASRDEVLNNIAAEAYGLFDVEFTALLRYADNGAAFIVARHHAPPGLDMGERAPDVPDGLVLQVFRSGRPARVEAYADLTGAGVPRMHGLGITAGAAAPILVEGSLWGVIAAMQQSGTVAAGLEHRLAEFAEIAATAVSAAQASDDLRGLADEQAALRRIAELVAQGTGERELSEAVTVEAGRVIGDQRTAVLQWDGRHRFATTAQYRGAASFDVPLAVAADDPLLVEILRTRRTARLTDQDSRNSDRRGVAPVFSLGVPILVEDRLWGVLVAGTGRGLPPETEERLQQFAELLAVALAKAEAHKKVQQLADQQAALRQVAELAARDAAAEPVLAAVAVAAARLAGARFAAVLRFDSAGAATISARSGSPGAAGMEALTPGQPDGAVQRVWRTGQPARSDILWSTAGGSPPVDPPPGVSTGAAVPISVQGALWGALLVVSGADPLAADIEEGIAGFAELAGTAISGAQARTELRRLVDEQGALRRVAELIARGAALDEVFAAVAVEASTLLGDLAAVLLRFDPGDWATTVATCHSPAPLGLRVPSGPDTATGQVLRTGLSVRVDDFAGTTLADIAQSLGVGAGVAVPVTIEGRIWGALTTSTHGPPLPDGTEQRLAQFAELTAAAIANADNKSQLTASRARVVATADLARRRLQRDVHDGAQRHLVHAIIALKLARDAAAEPTATGTLIREALHHAERANADLRDLVHGIHPVSLSTGGLRIGLESLIDDFAIPVHLQMTAPRLPLDIETTAYFFVAEALTNVAKHAHATQANVIVEADDQALSLEVRDDGTGGADPHRGTGLLGLSDRVEAADGTLTVTSTSSGTSVRATVPLTGSSGAPWPGREPGG